MDVDWEPWHEAYVLLAVLALGLAVAASEKMRSVSWYGLNRFEPLLVPMLSGERHAA
jgi:hypothetical protein